MKNVAKAFLPTKYGNYQISIYQSINGIDEDVVLTLGNIKKQPILTRVHSKCLTGDTFSSLRCDCQEQLKASMQKIKKAGAGILIYLNQEGRGIGLTNKIKAYAFQDKGMDTAQANEALHLPVDARNFQVAADILRNLGVSQIKLLTNNPDKVKQLEKYNIKVIKTVPLETKSNSTNIDYLKTKKDKLGHLLHNL